MLEYHKQVIYRLIQTLPIDYPSDMLVKIFWFIA